MQNFSNKIKSKLLSIIKEMEESKETFVKEPSKDFIRNRKLSFSHVLQLLLSMNGSRSFTDLLHYFNFNEDMPSLSALIQQRNKLSKEAMPYLFHRFTSSYDKFKKVKGYRLFAVDGSMLNIYHNPKDPSTHVKTVPTYKGHNKLHVNAVYDLCNKLFVDACIQATRERNESRALINMVNRSGITDKAIIIADRGYEAYNNFAHIEKKGFKYIIRVKDIKSRGITSSLDLPETDEFDVKIKTILTRKVKNIPINRRHEYKKLSTTSPFDFIDNGTTETYPMEFRIVRFAIGEDSYETIITNLDKTEFSSIEIKELYHLRWGIENSFRELKYLVGLNSLNSKRVELIIQEIYAKLTMYNFCSMIVTNTKIKNKNRKYEYKINFSKAISICKEFFKYRDNEIPPNVEVLLQLYISPIRNGRKYPRKITCQSWVNFMYRVA